MKRYIHLHHREESREFLDGLAAKLDAGETVFVAHQHEGRGKVRRAKVMSVVTRPEPDELGAIGVLHLDLGPGGRGWPREQAAPGVNKQRLA